MLETRDGSLIYGLPKWRDVRGGIKVGFHDRQLSDIDLDAARQAVAPREIAELWEAVRTTLPGLCPDGRGTSCIYTMSPDGSFILGESSENHNVLYGSACSGHGFKFAPAIGETLAELVAGNRTTLDISAFSAARFSVPRTGEPARLRGMKLY